MAKKTRFFFTFSLTTILVPFNSLLISCGEQKADSSITISNSSADYAENQSNKLSISQEIKNSIINGVYPDENQSILVVKELVNNVVPDKKSQNLETIQVESFLDDLASKLNKKNYNDKVELKGNNIIEDGLKKVIYENCRATSNTIRANYSDEFGEVTSNKILEINEDALVFELKPFGIDKILHDIGYDQDSNEQESKIADSQALKIYKFSTNLKLTVSKGGDKKGIVNVNDLNLFVVSDKEQAKLLKEGISDYLKKKFEKSISLYLNGDESGINSNDREIKEHFSEILVKNNYDLVHNEISKKELISYLANTYLPKLIYKKSVQDIEKDQQATSIIKIDSKSLILNSKKSAFLKDGMEFIDEDFKKELNFLNFFSKGNYHAEVEMNEETFEKITPEHFLKDKTIYEEKYYSLTSGVLNINQWSIRGFQIPGIVVKFELLIHCEILKKHIENLRICLRNVLSEMEKSKIWKIKEESANNNNYVVQIYLPSNNLLKSKIHSKISKKNVLFEELLNMAYIDPARKKSEETNFSPTILKNMTFNFLVKHSNSEDKLVADERTLSGGRNKIVNQLKGPIEIYFIFNSFKIKLTDDFFVSKLDNNEVNIIN